MMSQLINGSLSGRADRAVTLIHNRLKALQCVCENVTMSGSVKTSTLFPRQKRHSIVNIDVVSAFSWVLSHQVKVTECNSQELQQVEV